MNVRHLAATVLLALTISSCDDTTDTIGSSLTSTMDLLRVETDSFEVSTRSIVSDSVFSRSTTGYLGRIKDPETGAYITSDFMVQFNVLEDLAMPVADSISSRDESGQIIADSCEIRLFYNSFFGDSLAPMKVRLCEMATPMEEGVRYYSNYSPLADGLVRDGGLQVDKAFTLADHNMSDSLRSSSGYSTSIRIPMNEPYKAQDGVEYNNYGTYLLRTYYQHPDYYKNLYSFVHKVCPGFYVKTKEGMGAMAYIFTSQLIVHYRYTKDGKTGTNALFAGTEEVLQTTTITNDREKIAQLAGDQTCTYLKTPAGIFTEVTLPVDDITARHESDTLNSAKIVLSRMNNESTSLFSLGKPTTLLMCERDSMFSFFENARTIDNRQSFVNSEALSSSSTGNNYTFQNISMLIRHMAEAKANGLKENPDWVREHPNWNKVVLIPVTLTVNSLSAIVRVSHDMSMTSTRLVGGDQNPFEPIRISVIYSKFSDQ